MFGYFMGLDELFSVFPESSATTATSFLWGVKQGVVVFGFLGSLGGIGAHVSVETDLDPDEESVWAGACCVAIIKGDSVTVDKVGAVT